MGRDENNKSVIRAAVPRHKFFQSAPDSGGSSFRAGVESDMPGTSATRRFQIFLKEFGILFGVLQILHPEALRVIRETDEQRVDLTLRSDCGCRAGARLISEGAFCTQAG